MNQNTLQFFENICVHYKSDFCNESEPKYSVESLFKTSFSSTPLLFDSLQISTTYFCSYENERRKIERITKKIPLTVYDEIILVNKCCREHFKGIQIKIKDRKEEKEYKI